MWVFWLCEYIYRARGGRMDAGGKLDEAKHACRFDDECWKVVRVDGEEMATTRAGREQGQRESMEVGIDL